MSDLKFCGSGRLINNEYGIFGVTSHSRKDLEMMMDNLNEDGWVKVVHKAKRSPSNKATHYCVIGEQKPKKEMPEDYYTDKGGDPIDEEPKF